VTKALDVSMPKRLYGSVANFLAGVRPPWLWRALSRQRIELPGRTHFACRPQLAFPDHVHQFDAGARAGQCCGTPPSNGGRDVRDTARGRRPAAA